MSERTCSIATCDKHADVYAGGPYSGDWADYYCNNHIPQSFRVWDKIDLTNQNKSVLLTESENEGDKMTERVTWVTYQWKDEAMGGDTMAQVVILNDKNLYEELSANDEFDQRIWFYFQDEAEFKRAFNKDNDEHDFFLVEETDDEDAKPICPSCDGFIPSNENPGAYPGALSRKDNKTEICSACGMAEALADFMSNT